MLKSINAGMVVLGALLVVTHPTIVISAPVENATQYDTNDTPGLQKDEYVRLCKERAKVARFCVDNFDNPKYVSGNPPTFSLEEANRRYFPNAVDPVRFGEFDNKDCLNKKLPSSKCDPESRYYSFSNGLNLRRTLTTSSIFGQTGKLGDSALLEFTKNFDSGEFIGSAQGALFYPVYYRPRHQNIDGPGGYISRAFIAPSVSLHRVGNSKNSQKDINDLTLKLNSGLGYKPMRQHADHAGRIPTYYFGLDLSYDTTTNFDGGQALAKFSFEPNYRPWGIGVYQEIGATGFEYSWLPSVNLQAGRVIDSTPGTQSIDGTNYTRVGAAAEFFLQYDSRFEAHAKYELLHDLKSGERLQHLLTLGMDYLVFPENPNLTISAEYQRGTTPVKFQEIDKLTVGLGIKF